METLEDGHPLFAKLKSLESWLRRIINYAEGNTEHFAGKAAYDKIRKLAGERVKQHPEKYARWVDSLFFIEELSLFLLVKDIQQKAPVLHKYIKGSKEELNEVRNNLFHHRAISTTWIHGLSFFADNIILLIQEYFMSENKEKEFNVPMIVYAKDHWGREIHRPPWGTFEEKLLCWKYH